MSKRPSDTVRERADDFFTRNRLLSDADFLVALSGGSDSVALLLVMIEIFGKERVRAAHFDHALRGEESDADARFCERLCEKLGVGLDMGKGDVRSFAEIRKTGTEDAARILRYEFLRETAGDRFILTGHTADDQAETVLANFCRWSKLRGLSGIPERNGNVLRPLLDIKKTDLLAYLAERGQDFRTDSSNANPAYLRNRIRNRIVPEIETFNPGFVSTASRFARYASELDDHLDAEVSGYLDSQDEPKTFDIAEFGALTTFFRKEILSRLYARSNDGGIGLSEGMVDEMLRFCSLRYGGKAQTFGHLELLRKKGKITYKKTRGE